MPRVTPELNRSTSFNSGQDRAGIITVSRTCIKASNRRSTHNRYFITKTNGCIKHFIYLIQPLNCFNKTYNSGNLPAKRHVGQEVVPKDRPASRQKVGSGVCRKGRLRRQAWVSATVIMHLITHLRYLLKPLFPSP